MSYTAIDLARLPPPAVVETLDFETIFAEMLADLQKRDPTFSALVESDPAYKILEVAAYRELIIRQRINDAARAVMLAYAVGPDLDQIGVLFNVQRLLISEGDEAAVPPVPPVLESDEELRRRIQLSLEGLSVAGPEGAYIYHALSSDSRVLDASAISPAPGEVLITVLSREGDGTAPDELTAIVAERLQQDNIRPLTDKVTVQGATIVRFAVDADLYISGGAGREVVIAEATRRLEDYLAAAKRLGQDLPVSGIFAALHVEGVQRVDLHSPAADLELATHQAGYCTQITLRDKGTVV